ncbi:aminotransferase class V-fold PLP-dependent enzyme [Roseomonas sp. BN140053]|uniref:aminotransferase class V-fold PLP-dependent enzyme n=1 Tax=Roseomonas sp. BN140053 TaxID=3391898 RepID=UPI0039E72F95
MTTTDEPDDSGWLLYHSVGRFPGQRAAVTAALADAAEAWCATDDRRWVEFDTARARFLNGVGRLLNAADGTLFAAENITLAFAAFVDGLPPGTLSGRRVLIAADCFPSLHYLLAGMAERAGFELHTVQPRPGQPSVEDDDFLAAWDERVALAVITWVTSTASHRADLARLAAHGRQQGSLVAVDAVQGTGIVPLDVQALELDFVAASALKWLCGVPGAAVGYIRPALLPDVSPRLRGWFSKPDPFNWDLATFRFAPDARRFDTGTPSYLPFAASVPGVEWLLERGVDALREHNLRLTESLLAVAAAHNIPVASPLDPARRGGSVMLELPRATPAEAAVRQLLAAGVHVDARGQRLRLSPGNCTAPDVAQRFDRALGPVLRHAA